LTVAPTPSGGINYQVNSATVGPLDLPQDTIDSLKSQLDASLLPSLAPQTRISSSRTSPLPMA
jgi:hypothetical protein